MTFKRFLYVLAAVVFLIAWLVALGAIDADGAALKVHALLALGLCVGFAGHAA